MPTPHSRARSWAAKGRSAGGAAYKTRTATTSSSSSARAMASSMSPSSPSSPVSTSPPFHRRLAPRPPSSRATASAPDPLYQIYQNISAIQIRWTNSYDSCICNSGASWRPLLLQRNAPFTLESVVVRPHIEVYALQGSPSDNSPVIWTVKGPDDTASTSKCLSARTPCFPCKSVEAEFAFV